MRYRLLVVSLLSLLAASFTMNVLHYEAVSRAEETTKFDAIFYGKLIENLHTRLNEYE